MYIELSAPLSCQLELTTRCNQKCQHCYNFWRSDKNAIGQSTLSAKDVRILVKKLSDAQVLDIVITGGEPLLAFETMVACIEEANSLGIGTSLNSNLLLIDERKARGLRDLGITHVLCSLMGPDAATHDSLAKYPGAFESLKRGIEIVRQAGIAVSVNMVVSKKNRSYIKDTARLAQSLGVRKFCATKAGCPGNCADFSEYALALDEFRTYLKDLAEVSEELGIKVDSLEGYPLCGVGDLDVYGFTVGRKCNAGVSTFTVGGDGAVRPCPHLDESCGNLLTESLPDIWRRMSPWRSGSFLPTGCKACPLLGICGTGCRMAAKMESGDLAGADPHMSAKDVDHALLTLKMRRARSAKPEIGDDARFSVLPRRIRDEAFGAVALSQRHRILLLDRAGTAILRQLVPGNSYTPLDARIDWSTIKPKRFLSDLERCGLIVFSV